MLVPVILYRLEDLFLNLVDLLNHLRVKFGSFINYFRCLLLLFSTCFDLLLQEVLECGKLGSLSHKPRGNW